MIYEWYSGSDRTLEVPRRLTDATTLEVPRRIAALLELLELEGDRNWRGVIHGWLAAAHLAEDRVAEAADECEEALRAFDPFESNFRDVVPDYLRSIYVLVVHATDPREEPETVLRHAVPALTHLGDPGLDDDERSILLEAVGEAFEALGRRPGDRSWAREAALACQLRAHHFACDDPAPLRSLIVAHAGLGDGGRCRELYEVFDRVAPADSEYRHEVELVMAQLADGEDAVEPN